MSCKNITIVILTGILLTATGCKKYLDVQPTGYYTEDQVFANKTATQQALNGLYIDLSGNNLYGAALTQTYIELMAQRFRAFIDGVNFYEHFQQQTYNTPQAREIFDRIWKSAYHTIMSANLFLGRIDGTITAGLVTKEEGELMKGEALAIRALLHFDMLRIFGPVYSLGANNPAIPYYTLANGKSQPIISSAEAIARILEDLTASITLLQHDAITQVGVVQQPEPDFYTGRRNQRMNLFAVKALKARVLLWGGKNQEAHDQALEVITEGEKWFPWLPYTSIVNNPEPDRVFSTELLFAVYNRSLYRNHASFYSASLTETRILAPEVTNLRNVFENNENDWRYPTTWRQTTRPYRTFFKYDDISTNLPWGYLQPMIRKSELYYILAETETDPAAARNYLNTVRNNRGLTNLATSANIPREISKEYQKEFYGEGQLFFYYKRTNTASIPDAMNNSPRTPIYVVPLPLSETTPR